MTCLSPLRPALADATLEVSGSATTRQAGRQWPLFACGLLGALLLSVPGLRYRIDVTSCAVAWPPLGLRSAFVAAYAVALLLLTVAWLGILRRTQQPGGPSLRRVLVYGALINAAALVSPPFLSDDPLFYAAIGRVLSLGGGSAYAPLCHALPPGDPFLTALTPAWQCGTSAYFPGFHALAWAIGKLAGSDLTLHLRLYQLSGAATVILTGWVLARSLATGRLAPADERARPEALWPPAAGAAFIVLNPLCIIEGSLNAHNDIWLALGCAVAVRFVLRARPGAALLCLAASLAVKASAALLVGMYGLFLLLNPLRRRWPLSTRWLPQVALGTLLLAIALIVGLRFRVGGLNHFTALVGSPADPWDYCTRSVECLPRVLLRWILHRPTAAWKVGLIFRLLGAAWLASCAWRGGRRPLAALATGLFVYYLYLHGWAQSWYLLSLLPLVPFATAATRPAMLTFCISGCAYYGIYLLGGCVEENLDRGVVDLVEGLFTVVPPSVALWHVRNRTDV